MHSTIGHEIGAETRTGAISRHDDPAMTTAVEPSPPQARRPAVSLRGLTKSFGDVEAVRGVDLDISDGEFLCMLGPSGSGKTTVLRMIAGFEPPTAGTIELAGRDVTRTPAFERDVNTVFQDYALFPHMSVARNVEYGLRVKGVATEERRRRAAEALDSVALGAYGPRKPSELSGGQRQRVALARALVNRPKVLLLDEPLGALDLKLRQQMQVELKRIQRDVGITFVFVTHDQEEALTMSDRIVVFDAGRVEQVGAPFDVYERPKTPFVATFLGTANLLSGSAAEDLFGEQGTYSLRPERITIGPAGSGIPAGLRGTTGTVSDVVYAGSHLRLLVDIREGVTLTVSQPGPPIGEGALATLPGTAVELTWQPEFVLRVG